MDHTVSPDMLVFKTLMERFIPASAYWLQWPVLISHPAEGRRFSWPKCLHANSVLLNCLCTAGLRPERPPDCDRDCWDVMNHCWHGEPLMRPHIGEVEISLRAIFDRFTAQQPPVSSNGGGATGSQPAASSSNEDFVEIDALESLTTDSDLDFEELTLQ